MRLQAVGVPLLSLVIVVALTGATGAQEAATSGPSPVPSRSAVPAVSPDPALPTASAGPAPEWQVVDIGRLVIQDVAGSSDRVVVVGNTTDVMAGGAASPHYWLDDDGRLADYRPVILASGDGDGWTTVDLAPLDLPRGALLSRVVAGPAGFVASGLIAHPRRPAQRDVPSPLLLQSADGLTWRQVTPPADCTWITSLAAGEFGYVALGDRCRGRLVDHHSVGPGIANRDAHLPLRLLFSSDGVTWTSTTDTPWRDLEETDPWPWKLTTDGRTLLAHAEGGLANWTSTDGRSWTEGPPLFDTIGTFRQVVHGNGRFLATGMRTPPLGYGPWPHTCVTSDGSSWACVELGPTGVLVALPTGYATFGSAGLDPPHSVTRIFTSADGLAWRWTEEPALADLVPSGALWTSRGMLVWGHTNRDLPGGRTPFLRVSLVPPPIRPATPRAIITQNTWPVPGTTPRPLREVFRGAHRKPAVRVVTARIVAAMDAIDPEPFDVKLERQAILDSWARCQREPERVIDCEALIRALYHLYTWSAEPAYFEAAEAVYDHAATSIEPNLLRIMRFNLDVAS